jgi:hypothetical protein
MDSDQFLIRPDEIAYRLDLTPAQLKVTRAALKSMYDDFGHEEHDVLEVLRSVLAKLPDENSVTGIELHGR